MKSTLGSWLILIIIKHNPLGLVAHTGLDPKIRDLATLGSYCHLSALSIKTRVDRISLIALLRQIQISLRITKKAKNGKVWRRLSPICTWTTAAVRLSWT
jgi:hypothetical protein